MTLYFSLMQFRKNLLPVLGFFLSIISANAGTLSDRVGAVLMAVPNMKITIGGIEENDAFVTLSDVEIIHKGIGKGKEKKGESKQTITITLPLMIYENVRLGDKGGFDADRLIASDVTIAFPESKTRIASLIMSELIAPSPQNIQEKELNLSFLEYKTVEMLDLIMIGKEGIPIPAKRLLIEADQYVEGSPTKMTFTLEDLIYEAKQFAIKTNDKKSIASLNQFGYERFDVDMNGMSRWDPVSGDMQVDPLMLTIADVGTLTTRLTIGGLTEELLRKFYSASQKNAPKNAQEEMGLRALQALSLGTFEIRFDDKGLTDRVLNVEADRKGISRITLIAEMLKALPNVTGKIGDSAFQQKTAKTIETFLEDPKSIEIIARPASPIAFYLLLGSVMTVPQMLPSMIGLEVKANQ